MMGESFLLPLIKMSGSEYNVRLMQQPRTILSVFFLQQKHFLREWKYGSEYNVRSMKQPRTILSVFFFFVCSLACWLILFE
jgi:hypothetical protein